MQRIVGEKSVEEKTIALLGQSSVPVSIDYVAHALEINWATARAILLTLLADRRIRGTKTTKSWVFWVKEKDPFAS